MGRSTSKHRHTSLRNNYQCSPSPVLQSNSGNAIAAVAISVTLLSGATVIYRQFNTGSKIEEGASGEEVNRNEEYAAMTATPPPGRPGNLTPEQEEKLKEFWSAVLDLFGVLEIGNGDTDSKRAHANTLESGKSKKRKSLFGKKSNDDGADEGQGVPGMDGEDKYGQSKDFRNLLETQSPEEVRRAFWSMVKHDNPDGLLLRFLRARKWHVQNALVMLVATMHWRLTGFKVDDDILRRGEAGAIEDDASSNAAVKKDAHDFLRQMRVGKSFLHGADKDGRPICFVRVRLHKQGEQTEAAIERYTVYTIETARLLLHDNVDTADYAPVKFMIKCFEANYPESLGVIIVHKSPWIFHSVWKVIKGWLDPVVAGKVHFTRNILDLSDHIPLDHITAELGGKDAWQYSYREPVPGENDMLKDTATRDKLLEGRAAVVREYEATTRQWLQGTTETHVLEKRKELTEKLRKGYWELDPYVRARTYYDRTGLINPGGRIQLYGHDDGNQTADGTVREGPIPAGHTEDGVD
ncbi:MAG: hypothetical protein Q9163_005312 [Psora crenata]